MATIKWQLQEIAERLRWIAQHGYMDASGEHCADRVAMLDVADIREVADILDGIAANAV